MFFTDRRKALRVGGIAGLGRVDLEELFERRRLPDGIPIPLDEAMRPVEPVFGCQLRGAVRWDLRAAASARRAGTAADSAVRSS
ncbi:hypothetical protein SUDANB178_07606 [Streptomyces sp. enrichment culture]